MKWTFLFSVLVISAIASVTFTNPAQADFSSAYSKIDFAKDCAPLGPIDEESQSGALVCPAFADHHIVLSFGDIRESISVYREISEDISPKWQSFSQWNSVNNVFEFRLKNGRPIATIHRAFIDNIDPDTGSADEKRRGQVLVITSIAKTASDISCIVGLVDARANSNANEIAHHVADFMAGNFDCATNSAIYHGKIGPFAGQY